MRKNQLKTVVPNEAHEIIKNMENEFDVTVVTQNVDDLHERAGSTKVIHLHGELTKIRSSGDTGYVADYKEDLKIGDNCPQGYQLRPSIVLFHESLPANEFHMAVNKICEADVIIVVGTSLQVYPAASLPWESKDTAIIYYVDPAELVIDVPKQRRPFFYHIKEKATVGMKGIYKELKEIYL
jgi:NAD-dependent deacetylase